MQVPPETRALLSQSQAKAKAMRPWTRTKYASQLKKWQREAQGDCSWRSAQKHHHQRRAAAAGSRWLLASQRWMRKCSGRACGSPATSSTLRVSGAQGCTGMAAEENKEARAAAEGAGGDAAGPEALAPAAAGGALGG
ncbi:hypothetical protein Rsub_05336 [Raphidocelis subcapitata]|uniref:Uncharacterized protein n=1 Tax=Raphidocelis subcapitata TaxID=307507 RepID=A0A2V0P321_9CHLO|nr:hypothetical protein Rsub_05336 [Raphidocelis subcapitata]|eukprot:GBF92253.1 hypothetical protein Rsub_05336 [Raphidocelis subcapitata]